MFSKALFSIRKLRHTICPILFNFKNPSACPQSHSIPASWQEFQAAVFEVNASCSPCFCSLRFGAWSKTLQVIATISTDVRDFGSGWWIEDRQGLLEFLPWKENMQFRILAARESRNLDGLVYTVAWVRAHLLFSTILARKTNRFLVLEWIWGKIKRTWSFWLALWLTVLSPLGSSLPGVK